MSAKSNLFFKAMKSKPYKPFAEGGMAEEVPSEVESTEPVEDTSVTPEEKLAAYEILECIQGSGGDSKSKAESLAKSLKAFFLMVDAAPHVEGPHEGEDLGEMV